MKGWLNLNGELIAEKTPVVRADNRAFRYGDGLFETMKVVMGHIQLKDSHFQRLFNGMEQMEMRVRGLISAKSLEEQIHLTIKKNRLTGPVRVRLTMYRGEGGLYELNGNGAGYIIQVWPLSSSSLSLNETGQVIGLFEKAKKSIDDFSNLKSNNYLVYVMGAIHAKSNNLNDCLVLNSENRICDATIANVFWIKDNIIYTPPLSEGCVAGVMRANLLEKIPAAGFEVVEKPATADDLQGADELFLSNAINGIRWVKRFNGKEYSGDLTAKVFNAVLG